MRGFGRNANGSHLCQEFYYEVLGNKNVKIDLTNNKKSTAVICDMTGYSKVKSAKHESTRNCQVSHIFGQTKNIFLFTAPWNIIYLPKMIDLFTDHEAKGDLINEYQTMFQQKSYAHFEAVITDYTQIVSAPDF